MAGWPVRWAARMYGLQCSHGADHLHNLIDAEGRLASALAMCHGLFPCTAVDIAEPLSIRWLLRVVDVRRHGLYVRQLVNQVRTYLLWPCDMCAAMYVNLFPRADNFKSQFPQHAAFVMWLKTGASHNYGAILKNVNQNRQWWANEYYAQSTMWTGPDYCRTS